jgi:hypothetical protein
VQWHLFFFFSSFYFSTSIASVILPLQPLQLQGRGLTKYAPRSTATLACSVVRCHLSQVSTSSNLIHDLSSQSPSQCPHCPFPRDVILCTNDYYQLRVLYAFVNCGASPDQHVDGCLLRLHEAPLQSLLSLFSEHTERYTVARDRWVGWRDSSDSTRLVSCSSESSPFLSESPTLGISSCSCDYYPNRRRNLRCSLTPSLALRLLWIEFATI